MDPPEVSEPNRMLAYNMYDSTPSLRLALDTGSLSRWASILSDVVSAPTVLPPVDVIMLLCGDESGGRGGKHCESKSGGAG